MTDKRKGAEIAFASYLRHHGLEDGSVRQYRFALEIGRRWLFDWAWVAFMFAVELEGVTYYGGREKTGRHQTAKGFVEDAVKYEAALRLGWTVYRVPHIWIVKDDRRIWRTEVAETIRAAIDPDPPFCDVCRRVDRRVVHSLPPADVGICIQCERPDPTNLSERDSDRSV